MSLFVELMTLKVLSGCQEGTGNKAGKRVIPFLHVPDFLTLRQSVFVLSWATGAFLCVYVWPGGKKSLLYPAVVMHLPRGVGVFFWLSL